MSVAEYGHSKGMTYLPGQKWERKYNKNRNKFIRWTKIFRAEANQNVIKYKFGIYETRNFRESYDIYH